MERSANALAELAERLETFCRDYESSFRNVSAMEADAARLRKAQRIVAELAEVKSQPGGALFRADSAQALRKCRAIAEERADDAVVEREQRVPGEAPSRRRQGTTPGSERSPGFLFPR